MLHRPTRPAPRRTIPIRFTPRQMSWAAILFEAAQSDKIVKPVEINQIIDILASEFKLDRHDALTLCERHSRDTRRLRSREVMAAATQALRPHEKSRLEAAIALVVTSDGYVAPEEEVFMTATNLALKFEAS